MTLQAGTRLGPYEILSPLGAGGMGEVYRAKDPRLGRDVAIKVLPASFSADADRLRRFEQEAKAAGILNHPNITAVYDIGQHEGAPYVVQELLEGETLRTELAGGRLAPRKAIDYALQIAEGLAAAHEKGIVHRDLKPENLFVTKGGRLKILDFGLAKLVQPERLAQEQTSAPTATLGTEPGVVMGTAGYMSPEQVKGQPADHRSDIFSFGSILYEMLSGRRPFRGDSAVETMSAILKEDPPELSETNRNVSPGLERIVSHCLEKSPERRFQSASDLAFDLGSISQSSSQTAIPAGAGPRGLRLTLPALGAMVAAVTLLAAGVFGDRWLISRRVKAEAPSFRRLTFRRGNILSARFAPDGQTVVYGAAWEGRSSELFSVRTDSVESRPLGVEHANIASVSARGELAIVLRKTDFLYPSLEGTLASMPLGGGAPRELQEDVISACWAPDGESLAVIRRSANGKGRLEYPIGHVLFESFFLFPYMTMSTDGSVIFSETNASGRSVIWMADKGGHTRQLTKGWLSLSGLSWSRRTGEVLFVAGKTANDSALWAVSPAGQERILWPGAGGGFTLHDVSPDGRVLLERGTVREGVIWMATTESQERELGWLDNDALRDLSGDGTQILFAEIGEAANPRGGAYVRKTDGSPAVRLGDGDPQALSPDGKWALVRTRGDSPELILLPTGPGSAKKVPLEGITPFAGFFIGDGKRIAVFHSKPGEPPQISVAGLEGGRPKLIPSPGVSANFGVAFSPDGSLIAYATQEGKIMVAPVAGGAPPRALAGPALSLGDHVIGWSGDGRDLLMQTSDIPVHVSRIDAVTGQRAAWKEIQPADRAGLIAVRGVSFTRDGAGYAYSHSRVVSSDLYLIEGLK